MLIMAKVTLSSGVKFCLLKVWLLLACGLACSALYAQAAPGVGTPKSMEAIRKEFAAKDTEIAGLRRQLPAAPLPLRPSSPPMDTAGVPAIVRTRPAHGQSTIGSGTSRLYATDLGVTDSSAAFVDTPCEGKTLANAGSLHYLLIDGKQTTDYVTFAFHVSQAGKYSVQTVQYCAGGQGRYKVEVDGIALGQEMDFGDNQARTQGQVALDEGAHTLTYRATGIADDVAGYKVQGTAARLYCIDFVSAY